MIPRFYPILDTGIAARHGLGLEAAAEDLLEAGVQILQLRHKGFFSRDMFTALDCIAALCREARVRFVVNDRADLAAMVSASLHLGQDDLPPAAARRIIGPDALLGFSTHNEAQLRAAASQPADYLAIGPIFGTASKHNPDPAVGLEELRRLRPLANRPLVAIGGITRDNAPSVLAAGADSVAVIGDLFPADLRLRNRAEEWLRTAAPKHT